MAKTTTLMDQDGNSPVLFWTTRLTCTGHRDGTVSLWVVEESAFGRVTHKVATRASAGRLVSALLSVSDRYDLQIGYEEIVDDIRPRLAGLDAKFAAAFEREAGFLVPAMEQRAAA